MQKAKRATVKVAPTNRATISKIVQRICATMLYTYDVFNVVIKTRQVFGHTAIFAAMTCSFND